MDEFEILDLLDTLNTATDQLISSTDPFEQLDIIPDVLSIIEQLDGGSTQPDADNEQGGNEPEAGREPPIVSEFKVGDLATLNSTDFIAALTELEPFVGKFITFDQVRSGAEQWWEMTGSKEAA